MIDTVALTTRALIAVVVCVITIGNADAEEHEQALMRGVGLNSCAEFAKLYAQDPNIMTLFLSWAHGFMSAQNGIMQAVKKPTRDLGAMSLTDQAEALRYYCYKNSLPPFYYAVQSLYEELPEVPPQSK